MSSPWLVVYFLLLGIQFPFPVALMRMFRWEYSCRSNAICCRGTGIAKEWCEVNVTWNCARMLHEHPTMRAFVDLVGENVTDRILHLSLKWQLIISCVLCIGPIIHVLTLVVIYKYVLPVSPLNPCEHSFSLPTEADG